jgi:hypothetical protein
MRRIIIILILSGSGIFPAVFGQTRKPDVSSDLEKLFTRLVANPEDTDRIRINDSIKFIIDSYAGSDSVLTHSFTGLRYLGQVTSRNSQLKIITWNLLLKDSKSKYYCYLIHRSGKKNQLFKLEGEYNEEPVRIDTVYTEENWYGALYYDLRAFRKDNQAYWVLLGIDYGNQAVTRKIIEVLSFTPEGRILFGKELFTSGKETKYREVLEYSSGAVISLKFLTDKSIVFDHLVPVSSELKGQKEYYGPGFSFDAYNLERGMWIFKSDVEARNKKQISNIQKHK